MALVCYLFITPRGTRQRMVHIFSLSHARGKMNISSLSFTVFTELYIYHLHYLFHMLSTLLILAVCRMRVTYKPSKRPSSSRFFRSSVVRAPKQYLVGHGFHSRRNLRFFSLSHAHDDNTNISPLSKYV